MLINLAKDMSETGFKNRIKNEEKILIGFTKQKDFMAKENETLTRDIEMYKEKITKAEEKIKANQEATILKDKEVADQQKLLDSIIKKSELK